MNFRTCLLLLSVPLLTIACADDDTFSTDNDSVFPDTTTGNDDTNNSGTEISVSELGRLLFYDPILSGNREVACATCHHPDQGYADGRALSLGVDATGLGPNRTPNNAGEVLGFVSRNSPTILNTAFNGMDEEGIFNPATAPMFWDSRAQSLEEQALLPIANFEEMRGHAFDEAIAVDSILQRLRDNATYTDLFTGAFGSSTAISSENLARAIAEFERSLTATDSPWDQFQAGNANAVSQAAQRGFNTFNQTGCDDCHSGPMFSDYELHTLGVPDNNQLDTPDRGADNDFAFRTPTLRNLDETGPYFHGGVGGDLAETVRFYDTARRFANGGGNNPPGGNGLAVNPNVTRQQIDNEVRDLQGLNNQEVQDIVAFLEALSDPDFDRTVPTSVPSGLPVGGL